MFASYVISIFLGVVGFCLLLDSNDPKCSRIEANLSAIAALACFVFAFMVLGI